MNSHKNYLVAVLFACIAFLAYMVPSLAHHASTPFYDPENVVELQGAVTRFVFRNPHAFFFLDVEGEDGEVSEWQVELGAPVGLRRRTRTPRRRAGIRRRERVVPFRRRRARRQVRHRRVLQQRPRAQRLERAEANAHAARLVAQN